MGEQPSFACVTLVVTSGEAEQFTLTVSGFDDVDSIKRSFAKAMKVDDLADVVLTGGFGIVTIDAVFNSITTYLKTGRRCIVLETVYNAEDTTVRTPARPFWCGPACLTWLLLQDGKRETARCCVNATATCKPKDKKERAQRTSEDWMRYVNATIWEMWPRLPEANTKLVQQSMVKEGPQAEFFERLVEVFIHRIRIRYRVKAREVRAYMFT